MSRLGEFQAIVLAGGAGVRLLPLSDRFPKSLLPVANRPLLWYPLDMLTKSGFTEIIVVVSDAQSAAVSEYCASWKHVVMHTVPNDADSADCIRSLAKAGMIQRDFFVVPGDLVCPHPARLRRLADLHRTHSSAVSLVLTRRGDSQEQQQPQSKKDADFESIDYVGLDANDPLRLLYYAPEGNLDDEITCSHHSLMERPHMRLTQSLVDQHVYLFARKVADLIASKPSMESLKSHVVPYLVRNQFKKHASFRPEDEEFGLALHMSTASINDVQRIPCIAYVPEADESRSTAVCMRVITVRNYVDANLAAVKALGLANGKEITDKYEKKIAVGFDCLVGQGLKAEPLQGDRASVKKSIIGDRVSLGRNVRIERSIVMEDAVIPDNCAVSNCVIGKGVRVPLGVGSLKNTSIAPGFVFPARTEKEYSNATLRRDWH
jgi:translation initiation factor eIF-2B subunit gamma